MTIPDFKYTFYEISMSSTSVGPQFNFLVNNYLIGRKIYGIECYTNTDITKSPVSTGNVSWDIDLMRQATITLHTYDPVDPNNSGTADWFRQMPVTRLHNLWNTNTGENGTSAAQRLLLAGVVIDWGKSFICFVNNVTLTANTSALFGVYYK